MAVQPFLQSYVFQHAFESSHKNQQDKRARAACLALARKIPAGPVDAAFLTAFAGCFGKTNRSATAAVLDAALRSPTTANALRDSMFRPMLDTLPLVQGAQQAKVAHLLASCCISSKASDLLASACEPAQGVSQLRKAYSAVQPQDLDTRYDILFASFSLLSAAFPPAGLDPDRNLDRFLEVLTPAMEDASISDSKAPSWLADLETEFQYSSKLQESAGVDTRSDPRFEYLVQILQSFAATQSVSQLIASRVLQNGERSGSAEKGKARHVDGAQKENPALDAAVEQVATILPDSGLDTDLLRANLSHPNFFKNGQYDVESFVSAFFDGALPVSSSPSAAGAADSAPERPTEPEQPLDERTAFDQIWDETKMRVGKADQSKIIQEPISSDMKKSIIALAEAPDSDEEEEEDFTEQLRPGMRAVSMEDWEDEESGPPAAFVSSRQDGEDSDVSDEEEDAPASKVTTGSSSKTVANDDPFTPAVVAVLSEAYIEHGLDVLIRPNKTAKPTPARSALMQRLQHAGWKGGEDLIQSWGRVLDRDPKKQRRLEPYQFAGNRPDSTLVDAQPQAGSSRGRGQGPSRGGRGRGGGQRGRGYNRGKSQRARGSDRKRGAFQG